MAMKKCKDCGAEISKSAKVCPQCGKKQGHPVLRGVLLAFFIIIVIGIIVNSSDDNNTVSTSSNTSTTSSSVVTKENYDKIQKGMTKSEVKEILGEPTSVSENETPGVGTMELNHYQEAFSLKGIDVYYIDGKVYMKNWTEL